MTWHGSASTWREPLDADPAYILLSGTLLIGIYLALLSLSPPDTSARYGTPTQST